MRTLKLFNLVGLAFLALGCLVSAAPNRVGHLPTVQESNALDNADVIIIRHAERPDLEDALTPAGKARAKAYAGYFQNLTINGQLVHFTHLVAEKSKRTRETLEPLSRAMATPLDTRFATKEDAPLAADLTQHGHGRTILICWHHHNIPLLIKALGGDPDKFLPGGKWPDSVYDWMVDMHYDGSGHLQSETLIHEHLMPNDEK